MELRKIAILLLLFLMCGLLFSETIKKTEWLGKDKVMHATASAFITCWNYGVSRDILENSHKNSVYFSISLTTLFGAGKEFSDKKIKKTKWSWQDFTYDLVGISCGLILINNLR